MKIQQSFTVAVPADEVWAALIDIERIAPCLPGADITGKDDDGETFHGLFTLKIGPATAKYRGTLKLQVVDEAAHSATMHAHGRDTRGQGGATAEIVSTVSASGEGTRVDLATDLTITGKLARFGRGGMIEDISRLLMEQFAVCLQERLAAERTPSPPSKPAAAHRAERVKAIRLILRLALRRLARLFSRDYPQG